MAGFFAFLSIIGLFLLVLIGLGISNIVDQLKELNKNYKRVYVDFFDLK